MFTHGGIAVDSFARIDGDCVVRCEVIGNEAEFELGTNASALSLVFTEEGLEPFVAALSGALAKLRGEAP